MEPNPYSSPHAADTGTPPFGSTPGLVSAAAVQQLAATKPWVRFISVIIFIGSGFLLLAALGMIIALVAGSAIAHSTSKSPTPFSGSLGITLVISYALMAILYLFPGVKLWKYASRIGDLLASGRDEDLVAALNQQRSFWKFIAILMIIMIAIYLLAIIGALIFGTAIATKMH